MVGPNGSTCICNVFVMYIFICYLVIGITMLYKLISKTYSETIWSMSLSLGGEPQGVMT